MINLGKFVLLAISLFALTVLADNSKDEPPKANQAVQTWEIGDCWFVYNYVSKTASTGENTWRLNGSNFIHVVGKEVVGKVECFKVQVYYLYKKLPDTFYYRCDNLGVIGPEVAPSTKYVSDYTSEENIQLGVPPIVNSTIEQKIKQAEEKLGGKTFYYIEHPTDKNRLFVKVPDGEKMNRYYEYSAGAKFYEKSFYVENDIPLGGICITQKCAVSKPQKIEEAITAWSKIADEEINVVYTISSLCSKYDLVQLLKMVNINVPDENKGHGNDADHHDEDNPGKGDDKKHDNDKNNKGKSDDGKKAPDKTEKTPEPVKENPKPNKK